MSIRLAPFSLTLALLFATACAHSTSSSSDLQMHGPIPMGNTSTDAPSPDPRIGLKGGRFDAAQAAWNVRVVAMVKPSDKFMKAWNSDLTFTGHYVIQGSYDGYQIWDITNVHQPTLTTAFYCPASQSDVSVYKNLLIVSGEGLTGRLDCGDQGVKDTVSKDRLRGIRIFDISDIKNPRNVGNVQTCRGSHTHTVLVDPKDTANLYVYISGSAEVRPSAELPGCVDTPELHTNTALFHIEVIKIPLAHPEQSAIVSAPHIFKDLVAPTAHGDTPEDIAEAAKAAAAARAKGGFTVPIHGIEVIVPESYVGPLLQQVVAERGGTGAATAADSATLQRELPSIVAKMMGPDAVPGRSPGPAQCHDITVYPAMGLAGGACAGYGLLLDIRDPAHPVRLGAVADSNFSYWHSATFNNDGTKVLFSDEWGGGTQPKCRKTDKHEWGADAIFTIVDGKMQFQSYYKMPAPQTPQENCVAHDGSLIPIPGRDVMVQGWYQGGVSVFDWTDATHPKEIAFFDRGPVDSTRMEVGGSWSAYWYNGVIVSSEISRGLDILDLTPSGLLSQNEIDAAKSVHLTEFNAQGQPKYIWPASFALSRAYVDQLARSNGLGADRISAVRQALVTAEHASGPARHDALTQLATGLDDDSHHSSDATKVVMLAGSVRELATATSH
ncbi:MAG TPA: hypothetical protein VNW46_03565 [Gemmatimonadaceae bacterium]|nr:hypothetical protein [Gemmatimonadaceae bacterium]